MIALRKLSILAITALLLTGISGITHATGTTSTPTATATLSSTCVTSISLTDLITCLINSVGDDAFSTIDLSTLLNPVTTLAPAQHYIVMASPSSSGTSTSHYGPYSSGSGDSGTCGNNWADDTYNRHFTVFRNKDDGSLMVVEQFKDGSFVTPSTDPSLPDTNQSPGACQTLPGPTGNGGTVAAGITGDMHGYFVIPLPAGTTQTSFDSSCVSGSPSTPCTTTGFINSHFSPACYPTTCTVTTFFFHYSSGDQTLISHEWKNASADRGGNSGDIRSA